MKPIKQECYGLRDIAAMVAAKKIIKAMPGNPGRECGITIYQRKKDENYYLTRVRVGEKEGEKNKVKIDKKEYRGYIYVAHVHSHIETDEFSEGDYISYCEEDAPQNFTGYLVKEINNETGKLWTLMKFWIPQTPDVRRKLYAASNEIFPIVDEFINTNYACTIKQNAKIVRDIVIDGQLLGVMPVVNINENDFLKKTGWSYCWRVLLESTRWVYHIRTCVDARKNKIARNPDWRCPNNCKSCDNIKNTISQPYLGVYHISNATKPME
jgi:hypothetical protein